MIDPDSFPFLNISPFRTYFLFSLLSGGRGDFHKKETGEIFKVYGEKFDKNKIFFGNARKSRSVLHFSFFFLGKKLYTGFLKGSPYKSRVLGQNRFLGIHGLILGLRVLIT